MTHATYTDESGKTIERPKRDTFLPDLGGSVEFINALHTYHDKIRALDAARPTSA